MFVTAIVNKCVCLSMALLIISITNYISLICDVSPWTSVVLCTQLLHISRLVKLTVFIFRDL